MDFMVCAAGEPEQTAYIPVVERLGAGIELQSYGVVGASSPAAWQERLDKHRSFRRGFSGPLAVHGPFIGISYTFFDHLMRDAVRERMRLTLDVVRELKPQRLVLHTGFKPEVELFHIEERWIAGTVAFWRQEIPKYADLGVEVVFENLIERDPSLLVSLHDDIDHSNLKLCLDVGHVNVYSRSPVPDWIEGLGSRLTHVHLHDNHGKDDEHLPVGRGDLDFAAIFKSLKQVVPDVTVSLEVEADGKTVLSCLEDTIARYG